MDRSLPGSSVHEILQARILEWVAVPFLREFVSPRIKPKSPALQADFFLPSEPPGKPVYGLVHVKLNRNVCSGSGTRSGVSTFLCATVMTSNHGGWSGLATSLALSQSYWFSCDVPEYCVQGSWLWISILLLSADSTFVFVSTSARKVISNPALWRHCFLKMCSVKCWLPGLFTPGVGCLIPTAAQHQSIFLVCLIVKELSFCAI